MSSIVISGYYGFGNAGDEAMLEAILEGLRRRLGDTDFAVVTGRPEQVEAVHGVEGIGRLNLPAIRRALRRADLYLSGGGSLLQDSTSFRNLAYHLYLFGLARRAGARTMVFAQGVGPIRSGLGRSWAARVLRRVDSITVRDPASAEVLKTLGVGRPRVGVEVTADPAFALDACPAARVDDILREEKVIPRGAGAGGLPGPLVAIAPRGVRDREAEAQGLALVADWTVRHLRARPLLVPMQYPNDLVSCGLILERMKYPESAFIIRGRLTPAEIMGLLGRCELVVGVRLHALIFGAAMGVPLVGVEYDPKVSFFLRRLGLNPLASLEEIGQGPSASQEDLVLGLERAWAERAASRQRLAGVIPELRRAAERNFDLAAEAVRRGRFTPKPGRRGEDHD